MRHDVDRPKGDYRITVSVKNAKLARAIEDAGYDTQAAFARAVGIHQQILSSFMTFRVPPSTRGGLKGAIEKIALFLNLEPEDFIPPEMMDRALIKNNITRDVSLEEISTTILALQTPQTTPEGYLLLADAHAEVRRMVNTLPPRIALTIRLKSGLEDGREWTFAEIGLRPGFGVYGPITDRAVRMIYDKGMRMLQGPSRKHPKRHEALKEMLTEFDAR